MGKCECPLCGIVDASCYNMATDCYQCPLCGNTARLLTHLCDYCGKNLGEINYQECKCSSFGRTRKYAASTTSKPTDVCFWYRPNADVASGRERGIYGNGKMAER